MTSSRALRLSLIARQLADQQPAGAASGPWTAQTSDQAVNPLLETHLDAVYRYCLRLTRDRALAEDLTQETMLRGWRKQSALREPEAAKVWLLRIATNLWSDHVRRKAIKPSLLVDPPPSNEPTIPRKLIEQESVAAALAALDELPERQRQVMHLVTVEQMSQQRAAEVLDISVGAVKASLSMGRKQMRERLRDLYEETCGDKRCPTND